MLIILTNQGMAKFRISYTILGRSVRREIVITLASRVASAQDVAKAIINHEFSDVDAPFGVNQVITPEQALKKFTITDVKTSIVIDQ